MLESYDDGSGFATECVARRLETQKDILQLQEKEKISQNLLANQTIQDDP